MRFRVETGGQPLAKLSALILAIAACGCRPSSPAPAPPRTPIAGPFVIEGAPDDQDALNSFVARIRKESGPDVPSPFGQSDKFYSGHVFWDADLWVFPALALLDPEKAAAIPRFRSQVMAKEAWMEGAWEVDRKGKNATPPSSRLHAAGPGAYAFGAGMAADLGLLPAAEASQCAQRAADFYTRLLKDRRGIKGVRSIDEYAEKVDDELFTSLVASWCLSGGKWASPSPIPLPKKDGLLQTYAGDKHRTYQQAAAVLAIWPLQFPEAEAQAAEMMRAYADLPSKNGPAMTDSVHALIWARLGEMDKAYAAFESSWRDFTDEKLEFRENRKRPDRICFVTGAAGCVNAALYGFLGFRIDSQKPSSAAWQMKMRGGLHGEAWLSVTPHLPRSWKSVTLSFVAQGKRMTLVADHNSVTVKEGDL